MGCSISPDLTLDLRPSFVPKPVGDFLRELSSTNTPPGERATKVRDYIHKLEEEIRKIDAFKRELPLCMVTMKDGLDILKEELRRASQDPPVMEEFITLKKHKDLYLGVKKQKECVDKMDWMSSIHLGNNHDYHSKNCDQNSEIKCQNTCKNYSPFPSRMQEKDQDLAQGLCMITPGTKSHGERSASEALTLKASCPGSGSSPVPNSQFSLRLSNSTQQQASRKQRRCWSPELHRRFVDALQKLGGSQVATPKQIRELMQVDGLTNDEVKSHLQKYRLHTRRPPPAMASTSSPSVIVLRNLWVSEDQSNDSSKRSTSSPQGPLQLVGNAGMGSVDDEEDEKSESHSWKSHTNKSV